MFDAKYEEDGQSGINKSQPMSLDCLVCGAPYREIFAYHGYSYHRCTRCDLVATLPIPDNETIVNHYKAKFSEGNYRLANDASADIQYSIHRPYVRMLERELAKSGQTLAGKDLLDIGCFNGDFLSVAAAAGANVYGLELQQEAAAIAESRFPGRILQTNVCGSDFPERKFDIITVFAVIEHITEPVEMVKRCFELLKPGGLLMLETPDSGSLSAKLLGKYWIAYAPVEHLYLFSRKSLDISLAAAGFVQTEFRQHWKSHRLSFCYHQLKNFSPEIQKLVKPIYSLLPQAILNLRILYYLGEVISISRKP